MLAMTTAGDQPSAGVMPANRSSTIRAITLLTTRPSGSPTTSPSTAIAMATRRSSRRTSRPGAPSARRIAASRLRSVTIAFVVEASRTRATMPATTPSIPMIVEISLMLSSTGCAPPGRRTGSAVTATPWRANARRRATIAASRFAALGSATRATTWFGPVTPPSRSAVATVV